MHEIKYTPELLERYWQKVDKRGPDDCWQWLGYRMTSGHGRINIEGKSISAHRVAYELANGPIPPGLVIRHMCSFAPCCNPAHLESGTQGDNVRDRYLRHETARVIPHPLPDERPWSKFRGKKRSPSERFWDKVDKSGDCWLWTAAKTALGYGRFGVDGSVHLTHRFAWELENGPIPEGMIILHVCDTPGCVRVSHLKCGTHAENSADMVQKGRNDLRVGKDHPSYGRLNTHCAKGHELTPDNVIFTNHGKARRCLICYEASSHAGSLRYRSNHREEINQRHRAKRAPFKVGPAHGEGHGLTTLTEAEVIEIRRIHAEEAIPFVHIAPQFNVSPATIANIVHGKTWTYMPDSGVNKHVNYGRGAAHHNAILTEEKVLEIRSSHFDGWTRAAIAEHFGVNAALIGKILRRDSWRHI